MDDPFFYSCEGSVLVYVGVEFRCVSLSPSGCECRASFSSEEPLAMHINIDCPRFPSNRGREPLLHPIGGGEVGLRVVQLEEHLLCDLRLICWARPNFTVDNLYVVHVLDLLADKLEFPRVLEEHEAVLTYVKQHTPVARVFLVREPSALGVSVVEYSSALQEVAHPRLKALAPELGSGSERLIYGPDPEVRPNLPLRRGYLTERMRSKLGSSCT